MFAIQNTCVMAATIIKSQIISKLSYFFVFFVLGQAFVFSQNYGPEYNNGIISQKMQWDYDGYTFTIEIPFDLNTYYFYKNLSKKEPVKNYVKEYSSHPYFAVVVNKLKVDAKELGYTGWKLAEYLTTFVQQNITYAKDPYNNGWDYPKYPIETLVEKKGDCEDSAVLLASLLNAFGFDVVLIGLPRHVAVGILCKNCETYYTFHNKHYAYIETTHPYWKISQIPEQYQKTPATLTPVSLNYKQTFQPTYGKSCKKQCKKTKTINVQGHIYTFKPNEIITFKENGLRITISN